jgi:hypothetical protein
VSEFAEQIAWLAAVLRISPPQETPVVQSPHLSIVLVETSTSKEPTGSTISTMLTFDIQDNENSLASAQGTCWAQLFTNPILVSGYPILRKPIPATGLETSLGIMASLVQAQRVVCLENKIMMKGFNSLLIATAVDDTIITWHAFTSSKPDERISYFDPRTKELTSNKENALLLRSLEDFRHLIGWYSQATELCGMSGTGSRAITFDWH